MGLNRVTVSVPITEVRTRITRKCVPAPLIRPLSAGSSFGTGTVRSPCPRQWSLTASRPWGSSEQPSWLLQTVFFVASTEISLAFKQCYRFCVVFSVICMVSFRSETLEESIYEYGYMSFLLTQKVKLRQVFEKFVTSRFTNIVTRVFCWRKEFFASLSSAFLAVSSGRKLVIQSRLRLNWNRYLKKYKKLVKFV